MAIGTGLISLDVIIDKEKFDILAKTAGGSTGNVLTILSYFKWQCYPISYIGLDSASDLILNDLLDWEVKTDFIFQDCKVKTPIIIENLLNNYGGKDHEFKFKCPICNSKLPKNRLIPKSIFNTIKDKLPKSHVFYIDRLSVVGLELAKIFKNQGAIIFFEPHKISKIRLFKELLKIVDIVKYSKESINKIPFQKNATIEIQTLGEEGVNYSFNDETYVEPNFKRLNSFYIDNIIDSTGAGDWVSAALIHNVKNLKNLKKLNERNIINAINFGQALAALNCLFIGSRGLMYNVDYTNLKKYMEKIRNGNTISMNDFKITRKKIAHGKICPNCQ